MCFLWISEPPAIFSHYSINWLVSITEDCLLRGTDLVFKSSSVQFSFLMRYLYILFSDTYTDVSDDHAAAMFRVDECVNAL